jgi:holo-[acyl-carrier protein] synthase
VSLQTGVDLVEIDRIRRSLKNPRFLQRFFGEQERAWLASKGCPAQSVAANFCAKEAFAKAIGTGVRGFALKEVELLRTPLGAPYFHFSGRAKELVQAKGLTFAVSLSHTRELALAFVVATR